MALQYRIEANDQPTKGASIPSEQVLINFPGGRVTVHLCTCPN
jgi:hypothetical protein